MLNYYFHQLFCRKTIDLNLSSRDKPFKNDTLLLIHNLCFHKIYCVNLIRQIAHCLQ